MKKLIYIYFFLCTALAFSQQDKSHEIKGLKIYPNPVTQGKITIESTVDGPKKIMLFDVFGTPVMETVLKTKELQLPKIKPGIYVIRISFLEKTSTRKLVIK